MLSSTVKSRYINAVLAVALWLIGSSAAQAVVIQASDSVFGAHSVIRDVDHNRDFLQLVLTAGLGYNAVAAQLGPGGDFEGWSIATVANLDDLGSSAGVAQFSTDPAQVAKAEQLRDWFCVSGGLSCVSVSSTHTVARGLVLDDGPDCPAGEPSKLAFTMGRRFNVTPNEVDFRVSGFGALTDSNEEIYLTRAVPEPERYLWTMLGLVGVGLVGRRRLLQHPSAQGKRNEMLCRVGSRRRPAQGLGAPPSKLTHLHR